MIYSDDDLVVMFSNANQSNILPSFTYEHIIKYVKVQTTNCEILIDDFDILRLIYYLLLVINGKVCFMDLNDKNSPINKKYNKDFNKNNKEILRNFKNSFIHCMKSYFTQKAIEELQENIEKCGKESVKQFIKNTIVSEYHLNDKTKTNEQKDAYLTLLIYQNRLSFDILEQYKLESKLLYPYYLVAYNRIYPDDNIFGYVAEPETLKNRIFNFLFT